jgi:rhamnose transport system permease protein
VVERSSTAVDAAAAAGSTDSRPGWLSGENTWTAVLIVAIVAVVLVGSLTIDGLSGPRFWRFAAIELIPIALIALPLTFIILTGEIDLSVASIVGLSGVVMGQLWHLGVSSLPLLIAACLALGAVLGALNGTFVAVFGLPSLAVTIGTLALYRGLAYVILGDRAVADYPVAWTSGAIAPISGLTLPWAIVGVAVLALIFATVLYATPVGRALYAIGNNADAARFAGIAVARTKFWLYVVCGMVSALTGVFWTLRFASARADTAVGLELPIVAAVLLGGVSIFGGRGGIAGVVAAVVLLVVLRNALQLASVPDNALNIVTGTLLIISVVGPNVVGIARQRFRRRQPVAPMAAASG